MDFNVVSMDIYNDREGFVNKLKACGDEQKIKFLEADFSEVFSLFVDEDIPLSEAVLDYIVSTDSESIVRLPEKCLTEEIVEKLLSSHPDLLKHIPYSFWNQSRLIAYLKSWGVVKLELIQQLNIPFSCELCELLVKRNPSQLLKIPKEYWTQQSVDYFLDGNPLDLVELPVSFWTVKNVNEYLSHCRLEDVPIIAKANLPFLERVLPRMMLLNSSCITHVHKRYWTRNYLEWYYKTDIRAAEWILSHVLDLEQSFIERILRGDPSLVEYFEHDELSPEFIAELYFKKNDVIAEWLHNENRGDISTDFYEALVHHNSSIVEAIQDEHIRESIVVRRLEKGDKNLFHHLLSIGYAWTRPEKEAIAKYIDDKEVRNLSFVDEEFAYFDIMYHGRNAAVAVMAHVGSLWDSVMDLIREKHPELLSLLENKPSSVAPYSVDESSPEFWNINYWSKCLLYKWNDAIFRLLEKFNILDMDVFFRDYLDSVKLITKPVMELIQKNFRLLYFRNEQIQLEMVKRDWRYYPLCIKGDIYSPKVIDYMLETHRDDPKCGLALIRYAEDIHQWPAKLVEKALRITPAAKEYVDAYKAQRQERLDSIMEQLNGRSTSTRYDGIYGYEVTTQLNRSNRSLYSEFDQHNDGNSDW